MLAPSSPARPVPDEVMAAMAGMMAQLATITSASSAEERDAQYEVLAEMLKNGSPLLTRSPPKTVPHNACRWAEEGGLRCEDVPWDAVFDHVAHDDPQTLLLSVPLVCKTWAAVCSLVVLPKLDLSFTRTGHKPSSHLAELRLGHSDVDDARLLSWVSRFGGVRSADLSCLRRLTDAGVNSIACRCPQIESLDLRGTLGIGRKGVQQLAARCVHLTVIQLPCTATGEWLERIGRLCKGLREITVGSRAQACVGVSDRDVRRLCHSCHRLQVCISPPSPLHLPSISPPSPLQTVELTRCTALTGEALHALAGGALAELRGLSLYACTDPKSRPPYGPGLGGFAPALAGEAAAHPAFHPVLAALTRLEITYAATDETAESIAASCPQLTSIAYQMPILTGSAWFPRSKGMVTGTVIGGMGASAFFFNLLITRMANPTGLNPVLGRFPAEVYARWPSVLRALGLIYTALGLTGAALQVKPQSADTTRGTARDKPKEAKPPPSGLSVRPPSSAAAAAATPPPRGSIVSDIASQPFALLWLMILCAATGGLNIASSYKTLGASAPHLNGDSFLSLVGGLASLLGNAAGRIFWGKLSDGGAAPT